MTQPTPGDREPFWYKQLDKYVLLVDQQRLSPSQIIYRARYNTGIAA
jgi:hypothetical protein